MRPRETDPPVVLYVSDDTAYLNEVRHSLGSAGFSVVTAKSPAEVVALTSESEFDALLSDYNLLQTDALSLYEEIRKIRGEATPPTIVVADYDEAVLKSRCKNAGAEGVHVKTESQEKLIDRVLSVLRDRDKRNRVAAAVARRQFKGGTDTLTRVANHEHFSRRLNGESMASYRDQSFISVLMISVDRYDRLLDQYGKQRAEYALVQIARLIESELRSRDCVARYAESTFAVALPDTPQAAATAVGRRLRLKLGAAEFGNLDQSVTLTVSVGVATRPPGMRKAPKEMAEEAVLASEAAAKMGGDRVVADNALTGAPLVLLVGDPGGDLGAMMRVLESYERVETRTATSYDEACRVLGEVPVAMVLAEETGMGSRGGLDLLTWIKGRFPAIFRVLVSDRVDPSVMMKAINEASVHYFLPMPSNLSGLPNIVEGLLFT